MTGIERNFLIAFQTYSTIQKVCGGKLENDFPALSFEEEMKAYRLC